MDPRQLTQNMTHHVPDEDAQKDIVDMREAFHQVTAMVVSRCPDGRAKSISETKLEEALMWAIKSIVVPGA